MSNEKRSMRVQLGTRGRHGRCVRSHVQRQETAVRQRRRAGDLRGDIVLGTIEGEGLQTEGIGITGEQFRWPHAAVPFEIDPALPNQRRVTDAIAHWHANTRFGSCAAPGRMPASSGLRAVRAG